MAVAADKLCVGMITKAHGIKGYVCVHSYCDNPSDIFEYQPLTDVMGDQQFKLKAVGTVRNLFIAMVDGITNRNQAETLSKVELYIDKSQLPPVKEDNTFYVSDLIGLTVRSQKDIVLGSVIAVENFGAGDILECQTDNYKVFMIPFTNEAVLSVDVDHQSIFISEMAELFIRDEGSIQ